MMSSRFRFVLFPLAFLSLVVGCHHLQGVFGANAPEGDPGRDAWVKPDEMGPIYGAQCSVCHGAALEGSSLGPSLLADPLEHGQTLEALVESIALGFPDEKMPGWADTISAEEIRGLAIYILEKRDGEHGDAGQGIGPPPEIPEGPVETELHTFTIESIYQGLSEPYSISPLPDGRILVTEKMRGISLVEADGSSAVLVTGTPKVHADAQMRGTSYAGSGWAHEVAVHPDYDENGWIYFSYGDRCEACNTVSRETGRPVSMVRLVRGRLDGTTWIDQQTIWEAPRESYQDGLENGAAARIAFDDMGYVYLTVGTITDYRGIQDLDQPYGKIHRMHDDGRVPEDNPFVDEPGALPSIYTLGHRNAQGIDFDLSTGELWSSEHGPRGGDEGNLILPGRNYGWPLVSRGVDYDGRPIPYAKKYGIEFDPADLEPPRIDWTPSPGVSSIVFYRGEPFSRWQNHMLVATLGRNDLWRCVLGENGCEESEILIKRLGRFRDVEVGPEGDVLVLLEHSTGSQILRIAPVGDQEERASLR